MPDYVVRRVTAGLNKQRKAVNGSAILLIGLAYKKNTGDARESPAIRVAELLGQQGAVLRAVEPHVEEHRMPTGVVRVPLTQEELTRADAVVLLTDHDELDFDLIANAPGFVLDTRRRLKGVRECL